MANLIRTSKSGSDWTPNDLLAYNIRVEYQDSRTFFGIANLPQPLVDNEVLIAPDAAATQHDDPYILLRTMDLAMAVPPGEESAVDDFSVQLFKVLGHTKTDVCIMDASDILLLVQEDKRHLDGSDPEPQLIAEAIAAFYNNNNTRVRALGLPTLQNKIFPGITMKGTMPTFYKIPITAELVRAVQLGEYPVQETVVYAHLPPVPRPARRYNEVPLKIRPLFTSPTWKPVIGLRNMTQKFS
ncbi:hypothetical protein NP233_g11154 [Leucocoprinus birnbaumii]|uniref:Uncharacterized protein n=1 Tax=Leucocoprinus birnbaumii TaxID=56174 RepID=A0AAD5VH30_9AGAR|nr:hypothetical protein NP233_g11154 [Leucocoprinus birnbaumii]